MSESLYFDGVETVGVIGGNVRLELFRLVPDAESPSVNKRVPAGSLVMSLEGFLRTQQSMEKLVEELQSRNIITRKQPAEDNNSPNFSGDNTLSVES
ncbi:hypothetical protein [Parendozoicomonas haliclonae]|uniref:Uncharacterized protein n=1 Tax=Parendozoicomonas haliclonae TaxID=1960125 RepID=A0A1X7AFA0_9GAMM|nr:hypothetical protein [Parendozoicomonas haliclonae]SMA35594.1 hypothetical protein EHSB41UT_00547 [Parendozoicomonas haliclonae]